MYRVCLVGYGYWGINLARVISQNFDSELVLVCEMDKSKQNLLKKNYPNAGFVSDYKEVINFDIDIVVICTPISTHFELSSFYLNNYMHVFCEKPLAKNTSEVLALEKIAISNNLKLMVGHIFEYNSVVHRIKEIITQKDFGEILYISMVRAGLGPVRDDVNVVYDLATHDISILNYLLSIEPIKIGASGSCFINKNIEDVAFINLEYANNLKVSILVSWLEAAKERNIKIVGTKKMLIFNDLDPSSKLKIYSTGDSYQKFIGDFGVFQLSLNDGDILIPNIEYKEPLSEEYKHFIDCVKSDSEPFTGVKNAFEVVKIIERIQLALKE